MGTQVTIEVVPAKGHFAKEEVYVLSKTDETEPHPIVVTVEGKWKIYLADHFLLIYINF